MSLTKHWSCIQNICLHFLTHTSEFWDDDEDHDVDGVIVEEIQRWLAAAEQVAIHEYIIMNSIATQTYYRLKDATNNSMIFWARGMCNGMLLLYNYIFSSKYATKLDEIEDLVNIEHSPTYWNKLCDKLLWSALWHFLELILKGIAWNGLLWMVKCKQRSLNFVEQIGVGAARKGGWAII